MDISELLAFVVKNKASDLHLSSGLPPMIRVHGDIRRINLPAMEHKDVHAMIYDIMNDGQRKFYEENLECDFSFAIPGLARFRVNAFVQNRGAAIIAARGASSAFSAAQGIVDHVKSLTQPTAADDWFSAAVVSDGSYGVPAGLISSFPLRSKGDGGYEIVKGVALDAYAKSRIDVTVAELKKERDVVKDLLAKG